MNGDLEIDKQYPTEKEKDEMEKALIYLKKIILYFEIMISALMLCISMAELSISSSVNNNYNIAISQYFYEFISYNLKGFLYVYDMQINSMNYALNVTGSYNASEYSSLTFMKIKKITGVCLKYKNNKYDLNLSNEDKCYSNQIEFYFSKTINFWEDYYYFIKYYNAYEVNLYFKKQGDFCVKDDIQCGEIYNYKVCIHNKLSNNLKECPLFSMIKKEGKIEEELKSQNIHYKLVWFGKNQYLYLRNITDKYPGLVSIPRIEYRENLLTSDMNKLKNNYIDYYGMEYIDLNNDDERYTIMNNITDYDNNNYFRDKYFYSFLKNESGSLYKDLTINGNISSRFLLRHREIRLPEKDCLLNKIDDINSRDSDYISHDKLNFKFLSVTINKYISWCIIQFIFYFLFFLFYRGIVIYGIFKGSSSRCDIDNETISEFTKVIFQIILLTIKLFISIFQKKFLTETYDFIKTCIEKKCFVDLYINNSLDVLKATIETFDSSTQVSITLSVILFILAFFSIGITIYYGIKQAKFNAIKHEYEIGLEVEILRKIELRKNKKEQVNENKEKAD